MRTLRIVFDHPPVSDLADLGQVPEQIQVEQFIPISPVEAIDVRILVRFTGLDLMNHHPGRFGPNNELAAEEFGTTIDPLCIGKPAIQAQSFKDPDQTLAGNGSTCNLHGCRWRQGPGLRTGRSGRGCCGTGARLGEAGLREPGRCRPSRRCPGRHRRS